MSNSLQRALPKFTLAALLAATVLALGCGEAKPVRVVSLKVNQAGAYNLDGRNIELTELKHELRLLRNSGGTIQLHIHSTSDTKFEAVGRAVAAAQEAGIAQVSFITESPK